MVRLRLLEVTRYLNCEILFQSHYGAIATSYGWDQRHIKDRFQSHYGAIATLRRKGMRLLVTRFNPTMVRLRQLPCISLPSPTKCFNPTMVRLRPRGLLRTAQLLPTVSIPLWCDCDFLAILIIIGFLMMFQSHYGAIATIPSPRETSAELKFQSHYGAIATSNSVW